MSLIVQKFGGSSVKDAQRIENVAERIAETYLAGNDVIVVLSAQGDTTDDLIAKAAEINPKASKREMDMLLATGEQISVALCAMALEKRGLRCVSLNAFQVGIQSTSVHSDARIRRPNNVSGKNSEQSSPAASVSRNNPLHVSSSTVPVRQEFHRSNAVKFGKRAAFSSSSEMTEGL